MQPHPVWWLSICTLSEVKIPHDCVNSLYNSTKLSDRAALPEILVHHCIALFDMSLYWGQHPPLLWFIVLLHCMIWCICHCIITMSIAIENCMIYYVLGPWSTHCMICYVLLGTIAHPLYYYWKSCQMYGQRGLKVPPPIQSCRLETPKLVYFALYYLGMEHPSYCTIELMYHCIALFHLWVRSTQIIVLFTLYCIVIFTLYYQMYARTNWHKRAVRHTTRVCPSTTQYVLNAIELYRNKIQ